MSLTPKQITNFNDAAFAFIQPLEGPLAELVFSDTRGVPTVGYGYAMVVRTRVAGRTIWVIKDDILADFSLINIDLSGQLDQLQDIADALTAGDTTHAAQLTADLSGSIRPITMTEGRTLFDRDLSRGLDAVKSRFQLFLGSSEGEELSRQKERKGTFYFFRGRPRSRRLASSPRRRPA